MGGAAKYVDAQRVERRDYLIINEGAGAKPHYPVLHIQHAQPRELPYTRLAAQVRTKKVPLLVGPDQPEYVKTTAHGPTC